MTITPARLAVRALAPAGGLMTGRAGLFVGVQLDSEAAALATGYVDCVALAAADLVEHGLAREAESACGFLECQVVVRYLGEEAAAHVVCEVDPPGGVRRGLLGG